jgi:EAL domain-containing protein (putative c-di-GMP-specific phosphodiesterase class I)
LPAADATLRNSIEVGNTPPTGPQTLLNLLKLYESDNTDCSIWVDTLESHAATLLPFLAARPPTQLIKWHEAFTLEDLRRGALTLANQVNLKGINSLKIDKSFVSSINESEEATSIVDAIVAMAKGLKLNLIAEGVETDPQLEYLKNLGSESIQGYLFGKAEGVERTTEILNCIEQGDLMRNLTAV